MNDILKNMKITEEIKMIGWVKCPKCGEYVDIEISEISLVSDEKGNISITGFTIEEGEDTCQCGFRFYEG